MKSTGKEIVKRSINFGSPERIPMSLPDPYPDDFVMAGVDSSNDSSIGKWLMVNDRWRMVDEWGNTWGRLEDVSKGEIVKGVIEEDWRLLDSYRFPALDSGDRYMSARRTFAEESDSFGIGWLPGFPFSIARYMRRMEVFLADILSEQDRVVVLLDRISDLLEGCISRFAEAGADAVMFCEDWGTQDRLLVHPDTWRLIFRPGFERLCAAAHQHGLYVFMHSCGHVYDIIPDLIEAGIDVLQFDQPALHGIGNLARDFGGKVNFWSPVDIQTTLQTKNAALIRDEARELIEKLGRFGGGFMAGYYGANEAIGLDPEWQDVACRAFVEFGSRQTAA